MQVKEKFCMLKFSYTQTWAHTHTRTHMDVNQKEMVSFSFLYTSCFINQMVTQLESKKEIFLSSPLTQTHTHTFIFIYIYISLYKALLGPTVKFKETFDTNI